MKRNKKKKKYFINKKIFLVLVIVGILVIIGRIMSSGESDLKIDKDMDIEVDINDYEITGDGLDTGVSGDLNKKLKPGEIKIDLGEIAGEDGQKE